MRALQQLGTSVALSACLALSPSVSAAKGGLKPEDAEAKRSQLQARLSGDPRRDIDMLEDWGNEHGDPEYFLQAAELAHEEAEAQRNPELALRAEALAQTAYDIGTYLGDERNWNTTDWRPVTRERASTIGVEAGYLAIKSRELAEEIEAERAAAEEEARRAADDAEGDENKGMRPGTGLIIGGSVALAAGAAGAGLMVAGLIRGNSYQQEAESLDLLQPSSVDRIEELDALGANANAMAIAGGVLAGVGIGVGAGLIAVGVKKRRAAGADASSEEARVQVGGWFAQQSAGLTIRGSF